MSDMNITINGGDNQILSNTTEVVQNFYGDQLLMSFLANLLS